ncbi:BON domain-containing protein [Mucilaginibacter sp. Bleaf8]|uniref:BON domain-containing protein n=1 Tax=Mucilaginibacter sp. Bleaf8 TaxID=2834430 RepID=UPI001BCB5431|nr:BON domain-containing protein [Mucilaginibacter sp. Bleaf8]MBS7564684.1 BON domain-containing protein [Mucilaginibacter sp. Bleaf8]
MSVKIDCSTKTSVGISSNKAGIISACCIALLIIILQSCSQPQRDKEIKADIATKTKSDLNFAGVNYTVNDGMVTLTGKCASEKSKAEAEQTIKGINIIKGISNQIIIAPVTIGTDLPLKQAVDSVLKSYPAVQADVAQNIVTLTGKIKKQEAAKLMPAINGLRPASINNQMMVQ